MATKLKASECPQPMVLWTGHRVGEQMLDRLLAQGDFRRVGGSIIPYSDNGITCDGRKIQRVNLVRVTDQELKDYEEILAKDRPELVRRFIYIGGIYCIIHCIDAEIVQPRGKDIEEIGSQSLAKT